MHVLQGVIYSTCPKKFQKRSVPFALRGVSVFQKRSVSLALHGVSVFRKRYKMDGPFHSAVHSMLKSCYTA